MSDQPDAPPAPLHSTPREPATEVVARGVTQASRWALRLLVLGRRIAGLIWLLGKGWSLLLPLLLAVLLSAIPVAAGGVLRAVLPRALAALVSIVLLIAVVVGISPP